MARAPETDDTPRFTEADLRKAHADGWRMGLRIKPTYTGGYHRSYWDFSPLRTALGLGPRGRAKKAVDA